MRRLLFSLFIVVAFSAMNQMASAQVDVTPSLATYANLKAAFAAVNAGTHGATPTVTITTSYAEPDSAVLTGASITSCLITTSGTNTVTGNANSPIIVLNDADNVTIDGRIGQTGTTRSLTITNGNTGANNSIVCWRNGASNNTVRYINAQGSTTLATVGRLMQIAQTAAGGTGGCNNNTIEYNSIDRGARGIQVFGTANGVNSFTNDNTTIRGNIVKNTNALGIFIGSFVNGVTCTENILTYDAASTMAASWVGIQVQAVGTVNITKNIVRDLGSAVGLSSALRGSIALPVTLAGTNLTDPVTTVSYINNMFSLYPNNPTGSLVIGLQTQFSNAVQFANYTANVYNNTVRIGGASSTATAALTEAYAGNVVTPVATQTYFMNMKNNIFVNERTGGSATAFHIGADYDSSTNVTRSVDYNLYWSTGGAVGTSWATAHGSFVYPNGALEAFKANLCYANYDQHSIFKGVNFTSTSDLHLGVVGGDLNGTPVAAVTDDIDGNPRAAVYPWKGCDEGAAFKLLTLGATLEGKVAAADVMVTLRTAACGIVSTGRADVSGTGVFCWGDSVANGTGYYLDVTSLNHLQTVSAATQSFTAGALNYNFRSAQTQAFGGNMILDGANWAFYGGDVTQDGTIDASDGSLIDNDAFNFVSGCYLATDINSDGTVDATDAQITDNNVFNFISVVTPCPGPVSATVESTVPEMKSNTVKTEMNAAE